MIDRIVLEDDFKHFSGLNGKLNPAYGDGHYWNHMMDKHNLSEEELKKEYADFKRRYEKELSELR